MHFNDSGFIGLFWNTVGQPIKPSTFHLMSFWKDEIYDSEGTVIAEGVYESSENYYFRKIVVNQDFPVGREFVILEEDSISV